MKEQIKTARQVLGGFFKERRVQMGRTLQEVADHIGITTNTLNGVETGRFAHDIDLHLRLCAALEIKPLFAPLELVGKGSLPAMDSKAKFMLVPDAEAQQLYILHRHYPACLIQVLQTTPTTMRVVDLYDAIDEDELLAHPFLDEAKTFWKSHGEKASN